MAVELEAPTESPDLFAVGSINPFSTCVGVPAQLVDGLFLLLPEHQVDLLVVSAAMP